MQYVYAQGSTVKMFGDCTVSRSWVSKLESDKLAAVVTK